MALPPDIDPNGKRFIRYGFVWLLAPGDPRYPFELLMAPDDAGAPKTAEQRVVRQFPPTDKPGGVLAVVLARVSETLYFAARHTYRERLADGSLGSTVTLGNLTVWRSGTAALIPDPLPDIPNSVAPPTAVIADSGTDAPHVRISWTRPFDRFIRSYEVQVRHNTSTGGDGVYRTTAMIDRDVTPQAFHGPVRDGQSWRARVRSLGPVPTIVSAWAVSADHIVNVEGYADPTFGTPLAGATEITYPIDLYDDDTYYILAYSRESSAAAQADPTVSPQYFVGRLEAGDPLLRIPTRANYYRRTLLVAYNVNDVRGNDSGVTETQATGGPAPIGDPAWAGTPIDNITSSGMRLNWTNGDASATTRIFRGGVYVAEVAAAGTTYTATGLDPSTEYEWDIVHFKNNTYSGFAGVQRATTTTPTLGTPTSFEAHGEGEPGAAAVAGSFMVGTGGEGATHSIQRLNGSWADVTIVPPGQTTWAHIDQAETGNTKSFRVIAKRTGWNDSAASAIDTGKYSEIVEPVP